MTTIRKKHGAKLKANVAIEALKGTKTINEIGLQYKVHPKLVGQWKKQLQEGIPDVFGKKKKRGNPEDLASQLYEEIGRLKFELDWIKKKAAQFD